jgi:hypothetical protein
MKMRAGLLLISIFFAVSGAFAQERYVRPVDEAGRDRSFAGFRAKLIESVRRRDSKYLVGILDPQIRNDFGGGNGIADFRARWKMDGPDSPLWDELLLVLMNGGTLSRENGTLLFSAPYTFSGMPDGLDEFEHHAIFGRNVNLRSAPDPGSGVVARLSYNVVKVDYANSVKSDGSEDKYEWYRVRTLGGLEGFVSARYVRSPIDYRAVFRKNGNWRLVAFVAGD